MKTFRITALAALVAAPFASAQADEHRELGAHQHGVGQLDMAIEGGRLSMELRAPGADIVGFEHAASSDADRGAVTEALSMLETPLELFTMPEAAGCTVVSDHAELDIDDHAAGDEHHHDDEHTHEHERDEDHAHDEEYEHDEDHAHGEDHAHEHEHEDHAASHREFHAEYAFDCAAPSELTQISFGYFEVFPNALELELQLVSDQGAQAFEITREAPVLDLDGRL